MKVNQAKLLKEVRKKLGLKKSEMARKCDIHQYIIVHAELGNINVAPSVAVKMCDTFNLKTSVFLKAYLKDCEKTYKQKMNERL